MANIYKKTMRESLEEARDYRDPTTEGGPPKDGGPGSGAHNHDNASSLSYDEWLKQVKGIEKGAHGITGNEHDKYSKEWRAYATESKLTEIVGGKGEMTVTKDGGVMIIKTRDWQTYKAKGWVKREEVENESLELPATGDTITSNASQEVEGEELNEGRVIIATDKKSKKKWQFSGGMTVKFNGKQYKTEGVGMQQVLELYASFGSLKLGKKDIEDGFANGTFSVVNDGSVYQPWKNDFEPEGGQELSEAWNEKVSIKGLKEFRAMYKTFQNSGIDKRFIQAMEKLYDDMVIGGMYSSRSAEEKGILKIDGRTKYKNANW
jgi:hypothetical protein